MSKSTEMVPTKTAIFYPNTRGFGYAVMNDAIKIEEFSLYDLKKYDTNRILSLMRDIINTHKPVTLILENTNSKYCRKGAKSKQVIRSIAAWARKKDIPVEFYSREDVREVFNRWHANTKYQIADVLKRNIPILNTIEFTQPEYPGREPNNEAIFSAVSLGVAHYFLQD